MAWLINSEVLFQLFEVLQRHLDRKRILASIPRFGSFSQGFICETLEIVMSFAAWLFGKDGNRLIAQRGRQGVRKATFYITTMNTQVLWKGYWQITRKQNNVCDEHSKQTERFFLNKVAPARGRCLPSQGSKLFSSATAILQRIVMTSGDDVPSSPTGLGQLHFSVVVEQPALPDVTTVYLLGSKWRDCSHY